MPDPFSITVFATNGDPRGIRHVDKSNWSGFGVVFPRGQFASLKDEPGYNKAGIYILVGNAAEETIYVGEADPIGDRLKNHVVNKEGWDWGIYFFDQNHKIGKTEAQFLESQLVALATEYDRAILLNKNKPTAPTMSPSAKATGTAFLSDMLLILPLLGVNAFTPPTPGDVAAEAVGASPLEASIGEKFDTVIVPAHEEGFQQRFLAEGCWFAIRINAANIPKLKYIAAYRVAPIKAITHIAEIAKIEPYGTTGKYLLRFAAPAQQIGPIPRIDDSQVNMQSPRYALRDKVLVAKNLDSVWI